MMNKFYVTFGQNHIHEINGKILDRDTVAVIEIEGYDAVLHCNQIFNGKFSRVTTEQPEMRFYPNGLVEI